MQTAHFQFAIAACGAAVLSFASSGIPAQENNGGLRKDHAGETGFVILPGGHKQPIYLDLKDGKDQTFSGTITYDLGLREQVFEITGTIDKAGRKSFQELPGKGVLHPHSPVRGGGKFETTESGRLGFSGVALLRLTKGESIDPVKCEFVFGVRALLGR